MIYMQRKEYGTLKKYQHHKKKLTTICKTRYWHCKILFQSSAFIPLQSLHTSNFTL